MTSRYHSQRMLLYKSAEQLTSGLGRFLECRKYNMLFITQVLSTLLEFHNLLPSLYDFISMALYYHKAFVVHYSM